MLTIVFPASAGMNEMQLPAQWAAPACNSKKAASAGEFSIQPVPGRKQQFPINDLAIDCQNKLIDS